MKTTIELLKIPFRQKTRSGCGSYSLANLLNDDRFLKGIEDLKFGEGVADMNKKLERLETDLFIDVIFASPSEMTAQPNRLIDPLVFKVIWEKMSQDYIENFARPFLITVKGTLFHCLLVLHNFKNDRYYIVDSLKSHVMVATIGELFIMYHITAVELVCSWNMRGHEDRSIFINKTALTHLIQEGE